MDYRFSDRFELGLNGFYDTFIMTNRFRTNLIGKWYGNENLHFFSGLEIEMETNKYQRLKQMPPRIGFFSGVGYDVNSNFIIKAGSNIQINSYPMGTYGEYFIPMPQVYTLGGKIKF